MGACWRREGEGERRARVWKGLKGEEGSRWRGGCAMTSTSHASCVLGVQEDDNRDGGVPFRSRRLGRKVELGRAVERNMPPGGLLGG